MEIPTPVREVLGGIAVTPGASSNVYVDVARVTLPPGARSGPFPSAEAGGEASVAYVESGAVCFYLAGPEGATAQVTAKSGLQAGIPESGGCHPPDASCAQGCALKAPGAILLVAGDSVTQGQTAASSFINAAPVPVVLVMTQLASECDSVCQAPVPTGTPS